MNATTPASSLLKDIWNTPNLLTFARILMIPAVCVLLLADDRLMAVYAAILFGIAGFTDWLDGWLARRQQLVSMTGKFLDPLADKLLVMAVLVCLVEMGRIPAWFVVLLLARETSITSLRALAAGEGMIMAADWGGKWKTALQLVGLPCLLLHFSYTIHFGFFVLDVRFHAVGMALMALSLVFSLASGFTYFRNFLRSATTAAGTPAG